MHDDPALVGRGHQEPGAELRPEHQRAHRDDGVHGQGQARVPGGHRRRSPIRGADNALAGRQRPSTQSQHFAIVLDNELVSVPYIDYRENPDGIDGETGAADLRLASPSQSAQDLANFLKIGALPIRLELISPLAGVGLAGQAGARPGPQGGHRGLRRSSRSSCSIFYRVLGVIAVAALAVYALYFYALVKLIPIVLTLPGIAGLILDARRRGGREHRHLRTRQGGGQTRQIDGRGHRRGLQEGHRDDHRRERRHVPRRLHPLHPRDGGRQGLRASRSASARIVSLFTAVLATQAILLSLRGTDLLKSKVGARRRPRRASAAASTSWARSKWFFSAVRRHPADRRAGHRRQGPRARHRLRVRHADHRRRSSEPATVERGARRRSRTRGFDDVEVQTRRRPRARRQRRPDLDGELRAAAGRPRRGRARRASSALESVVRRTRSARRSASRSPTRRSSRSSPRCW